MTERTNAKVMRDADLIDAASTGDVTAFEELVATRLNRSFRTASAILGSEADAHDVVQEAFLAVWHRLPTLRDHAKFDAWLNAGIVNRCRDVLRRRRRSREVELTHALNCESADESDALVDFAMLNAAFERLSAEQRHLLVMHHLHGMSVVDLAAELSIPSGTAKWRLHAARTALERALRVEQ